MSEQCLEEYYSSAYQPAASLSLGQIYFGVGRKGGKSEDEERGEKNQRRRIEKGSKDERGEKVSGSDRPLPRKRNQLRMHHLLA